MLNPCNHALTLAAITKKVISCHSIPLNAGRQEAPESRAMADVKSLADISNFFMQIKSRIV